MGEHHWRRASKERRELRLRPDATATTGESGTSAVTALQRAAGNAAVNRALAGPAVRRALGSGGTPLQPVVRSLMEERLGADFSTVRVHTDAAAQRSAALLSASAYTAGEHIAFARGRYDPASQDGRRVLAHELAHVVQQRAGPVDGAVGADGLKVSDPSDRFEQAAEAVATRVV